MVKGESWWNFYRGTGKFKNTSVMNTGLSNGTPYTQA